MEVSLDRSVDFGDCWENGLSVETLNSMDLQNTVFDDATFADEISHLECSSTDHSKQSGHDANSYNKLPSPSQSQPPTCSQNLSDDPSAVLDFSNAENASAKTEVKHQCWDHGCDGREFSSKSNLVRHMKEKAGESAKVVCPLCGGFFSRNSARDTHLAKQSCNRIRRYSNGRLRASKMALLSNPNLVEGVHY